MLCLLKLISLFGCSKTTVQIEKSFNYNPEIVKLHIENIGEIFLENSGSFPLKFVISNNQAILIDVGESYDPNEKDRVIILLASINNFKVTEVSIMNPQTEKRFQNHLKVFDMTIAIFFWKFNCKGLNANITKINPDLDPFYDPIVDLPLNIVI